jgi:hypothetical protein
MASIPLPVAMLPYVPPQAQTPSDNLTMMIEAQCQKWLAACQCAAQATDLVAGKNAQMKSNLQLMQTALQAWVTALTTQIATL